MQKNKGLNLTSKCLTGRTGITCGFTGGPQGFGNNILRLGLGQHAKPNPLECAIYCNQGQMHKEILIRQCHFQSLQKGHTQIRV